MPCILHRLLDFTCSKTSGNLFSCQQNVWRKCECFFLLNKVLVLWDQPFSTFLFPKGLTILRMVFIFSMIFGMCNCKRGMVNEVYIGQRYSCNNGKKILDSVKSEMQCIHLCLRHEACGYMNYIEENEHKTTKRTCEVMDLEI